MGKPGSKQGDDNSPFGSFKYQFRYQKMVKGSDPTKGRKMSGGVYQWDKFDLFDGLRSNPLKLSSLKGGYVGKRHTWIRKHFSSIVFTVLLMGFLFLLDSLMGSFFEPSVVLQSSSTLKKMSTETEMFGDVGGNNVVQMYGRLTTMASGALAERELKQEESKFWKEPYRKASLWSPCADRKESRNSEKLQSNNGFILVSANGGLNQQRVAVCNAVAVASVLNATLVIPKFLYSNVWKDPSQFGDIYQEDYFMKTLKDEVNIVKDLPSHFESLDFKEIGSLITDADLTKEATPVEYIKKILPILLKNGVVHFLGYGNRLGFDPFPSEIQRLRCKCNYHALKFVPKIQEIGSLLIRRIRKYDGPRNKLDKHLLGSFITNPRSNGQDTDTDTDTNIDTDREPLKYLALHLRFEVDMVAYSLCDFGGGKVEKDELQTYRESHFPLLMQRLKKSKRVSSEELRSSGRCPLTPEEAGLVLAGLGFMSDTYIYLAGSHIYGGKSRLRPLTNLYPNLITKEDLLSPTELAPFNNFSSQLAALDFIACATSDVFAITDSGSQLSSLVFGYRTYYGGGHAPTLRPNKKRLADILSKSETINWKNFEGRVKNMITEGQTVRLRGWGRSIYRQPRCPECMCRFQ